MSCAVEIRALCHSTLFTPTITQHVFLELLALCTGALSYWSRIWASALLKGNFKAIANKDIPALFQLCGNGVVIKHNMDVTVSGSQNSINSLCQLSLISV